MAINESAADDRTCGTCIYNEDGLCDRFGWLVNDDDKRCNGKYWEGDEKK